MHFRLIISFFYDQQQMIFDLDDIIISNTPPSECSETQQSSCPQNAKNAGLIELTKSELIITNQYAFLWNVLPKITGKLIRKNQFVKEMKLFGFELLNLASYDKEINKENCGIQESEKSLVFRARNREYHTSLYQMRQITGRKIVEKNKLNEKVKNLSLQLQEIGVSIELNNIKQLQLLQEVSSLKNINRNLLILNEEANQLFLSDCFQPRNCKINQIATFDLLSHCLERQRGRKNEQYQLHSMRQLDTSNK